MEEGFKNISAYYKRMKFIKKNVETVFFACFILISPGKQTENLRHTFGITVLK
jgi:hypothetical protein